MSRFLRYALLLFAVALVADVPANAYAPWSPGNGPAQTRLLTTGGALPWVTAFDFDFTANGSVTFTSDGATSYGGLTWTKFNSVNETTHAAASGSGLVFLPASTASQSQATRNAPGIFLPFSQISALSGVLAPATPLRIWYQVTNSVTNNTQPLNCGSIVAVTNSSGVTGGLWVYYYSGYGHNGSSIVYDVESWVGTSTGAGGSTVQQPSTTSGAAVPTTLMMGIPGGLIGGYDRLSILYNNVAPPWPSFLSLNEVNASQTGFAGSGSIGSQGLIGANNSMAWSVGNFGVFVGMSCISASMTTTFGRLRIDYLPTDLN